MVSPPRQATVPRPLRIRTRAAHGIRLIILIWRSPPSHPSYSGRPVVVIPIQDSGPLSHSELNPEGQDLSSLRAADTAERWKSVLVNGPGILWLSARFSLKPAIPYTGSTLRASQWWSTLSPGMYKKRMNLGTPALVMCQPSWFNREAGAAAPASDSER